MWNQVTATYILPVIAGISCCYIPSILPIRVMYSLAVRASPISSFSNR